MNCRICNNDKLETVLNLGNIYPSGFVPKDEDMSKHTKYPLDLARCLGCGLVQLRDNPELDTMYRQYWYKSSLNKSMVDALQNVVDSVMDRAKLPISTVTDIGANDGTMIAMYKDIDKNITTIGFDPARNLADECKSKCDYYINEYFNKSMYPENVDKSDIVTSIACFYDLIDVNKFIEDVRAIMKKDGIFVVQYTDLLQMMKVNAFDNMCFLKDAFISGIDKNIQNVEINDPILDKYGNQDSVINTFSRNHEGEIFKIKAKYVYPFDVTEEHPFLIVKSDTFRHPSGKLKSSFGDIEPVWVKAKDLKKNDYLLVPKIKSKGSDGVVFDLTKYNKVTSSKYRKGLLNVLLTEDFAWFVGLYVAEGFINGKESQYQVCLTLNKNETEYVNRVKKYITSIGYSVYVLPHKKNNSMDIRIQCNALALFLKDMCGQGAHNKKIPDFILESSSKIRRCFLKGLFDGDGSYIRDNNKNRVQFCTVSKTLTFQVQSLLFSEGCALGIVKSVPKKHSVMKNGYVIKSGECYRLAGSSKELMDLFDFDYKGIPKKLQNIQDDNYFYVPISDIKKHYYSGEVFNLETNTHTYVVNNIVTHNCHEHIEYYSFKVLNALMNKHDMEIFDVETNNVNGGSVRAFICNKGQYEIKNTVQKMIDEEDIFFSKWENPFDAFKKRVELIKENTFNFIYNAVNEGKKVLALGCSTKGNTTLQYFNIDSSLISYGAEVNKDKFGLKTLGSNIEIISEKEAFEMNPDYFLVLPWHFIDSMRERYKEYLDKGGAFIVPCPEFKIITNSWE